MKHIPHFFISEKEVEEKIISDDIFHHLIQVLRFKESSLFTCAVTPSADILNLVKSLRVVKALLKEPANSVSIISGIEILPEIVKVFSGEVSLNLRLPPVWQPFNKIIKEKTNNE